MFTLEEKVQPMREYECHKRVRAAKITEINTSVPRGVDLTFAGGITINVTAEWYTKHRPDIGGYYVQYADGYTSFSPALAFETGYTLVAQ